MGDEGFEEFMKNFDVKAYYRRLKSSDYYKERIVPKITSIINNHYNREIEKRIIFKENNHFVSPEFTTIKIKQKALDKGKYISKRVCELAGSDYEIYMYLLGNNENKDKIVDDIYIGINQVVYPDYCEISPYGKIKSSRNIRKNLEKRVIGHTHSHGAIETFHSITDVKNLEKFIESFGNLRHIDLWDDEEGKEQKLYDVYYTPSLVFNKYLWGTDKLPFAGVALNYKDFGNKIEKIFLINNNVNIEVIESDPLTEEEMKSIDELILDRVNLGGRGNLRQVYEKQMQKQDLSSEKKWTLDSKPDDHDTKENREDNSQ